MATFCFLMFVSVASIYSFIPTTTTMKFNLKRFHIYRMMYMETLS
ncbi:hypothetical protein PBCV1_a078cL [Paramecium bursaria Chlorella virus 1]|uniref:Uncharacterized protein n=1 Tax=Paramecium bursaria Chlorella virus 1 TaxID=10506 RepID=F8TTX1_PBCV1|nr:hypothetical protein PBCV1_a078cL [Paramecium bursaria Chlorella virus 1]AEI70032.1 hypothetical protein [Paramecium bursaria Chlorella virus 1]